MVSLKVIKKSTFLNPFLVSLLVVDVTVVSADVVFCCCGSCIFTLLNACKLTLKTELNFSQGSTLKISYNIMVYLLRLMLFEKSKKEFFSSVTYHYFQNHKELKKDEE